MATMSDVVKGLNILQKYDPTGDVCSEHDILYASKLGGDAVIAPEDLRTLDEAGWFFSTETDSWAKFT